MSKGGVKKNKGLEDHTDASFEARYQRFLAENEGQSKVAIAPEMLDLTDHPQFVRHFGHKSIMPISSEEHALSPEGIEHVISYHSKNLPGKH